MNLKQLIIAFLSPRYPAAYTEAAIAQRLNASQMLDKRCTVDEVSDALRALHKMKMVDLQIDQMDNSAVWQVTEEGSKRWVLEGRVAV
jgi:hypothetical protein